MSKFRFAEWFIPACSIMIRHHIYFVLQAEDFYSCFSGIHLIPESLVA
jgi:hypothetical protein